MPMYASFIQDGFTVGISGLHLPVIPAVTLALAEQVKMGGRLLILLGASVGPEVEEV